MAVEHRQVESIFNGAAAVPPSERPAFLDRACGGNDELRRHVESLLQAHESAGTFLSAQARPTATAGAQASSAGGAGKEHLLVGTTLGRYRLLEVIGEGGMGLVYRAEQREPIHRVVALKLIKLGMDTRQVIARFESERQALALMNHPNVAAVYDAGATDAGRPYFVMEYVPGTPITTFCDRHKYSTRRRLELFLQACDAVQHAHTKAIIHRDLKPGNILVTLQGDRPVVKVIDFGVAKATAQRLTEHTVFTETGQLIGTPEYMSPEQAELNPVDVDTRTDVYSLGVVLYELLAGALPFDSGTLRRAAYAQIQAIIREVDPPRPSTRVSSLEGEAAAKVAEARGTHPASLRRELRGELEWIPLMAMRKDRARRYRAAIELANDIHNYLANRPLLAGPESKGYRLRKFARRNRIVMFASAVVVAGVLLALAGLSIGLISESRRRSIAERERREAQFNMAIAMHAQENLDAAEEELQRVLASAAASADPADVQRRALARLWLAQVVNWRGREADSTVIARLAVEEHRAAFPPNDRNTAFAVRVLGQALARSRPHEAVEVLGEAVARFRAVEPADAYGVGFALLLQADALRRVQRYDEAERALREALTKHQETFPSGDPRVNAARAELARLLVEMGRFGDAEAELEEIDPRHHNDWSRGLNVCIRLLLYTAWHLADPGKGHDRQAYEWQLELARHFVPLPASTTRPAASADSPVRP